MRCAGLDGTVQKQEERREGQQHDHGKAPVHGEQIGHGNQHGAHGAAQRGEKVRGQAVQCADVVLHGPFHFA
ncbi:hypothetical protein D3C72_2149340 [compost metagenome]